MISRLGISLCEGNGYAHEDSGLESSTDREPGRLQSMGLQRFGHNRATFAFIGCAKHIGVNMYYQCWNQKSLENCDEPIENKASYTRKKNHKGRDFFGDPKVLL